MLKKIQPPKTKLLIYIFPVLLAGVLILFTSLTQPTEASGTITGTVYIDYNMNGTFDSSGAAPDYAIDSGISGIVVTAYDSSGTVRGTATTGTGGTYSLTATGTGPYRLEFTNLQGYSPSAVGTNNASEVKFVADGNSSGNDFGIIYQTEYCQNDPDMITNTYIDGDTAAGDVLLNFPYSAGAPMTTTTKPPYENPTTHSIVLDQIQIGTTWGLTYARRTNRIYAASFFKKHTLFGPDGSGAIYVINPANNSVVQTITVPNAATNSHGTTNVCTGTHSAAQCDNGNTGWDAVGKTSLGGMDISEDETKIYVMNLENRTLYELDAVSGAALRWQSMPGVPNVTGSVNNLSGAANRPPGAAAAGDVRPFAVSYLSGKIYVGIISSAESTPATLTNLQAHVYEVDPTTFAFTRRLSATMDYGRNAILRYGANNTPAEWNAWRTTYATAGSLNTGIGGNEVGYPQPMLTGIEFDNAGNLVMGIRDRSGDQMGFFVPSNPTVNALLVGDSAGDTLKACGNQTSGWTLESNSRCGGQGTGVQNNGEGVGNGEFYHGDGWGDGTYFHDEISLGGLEQLFGRPEITSTVYDPVNLNSGAFSAGARWWNNSQGNATRGYNIFTSPRNQGAPTFGKANGLGDLIAMCNPAPLQIGNRVWNDTNGNGRQDPGENGIGSVAAQLWADTNSDQTIDTQIGTTVTDSSGNYIFGGTQNTNLSNYSCGTTFSTVDVRVNASTDDAEQTGTTMNLTSTDLDLDGTLVGVRFSNLTIPQGATITNAYIQFTADNAAVVSLGSPAFTIRGQNIGNAPTFMSTASDISGRATTTQSAPWSPGPWTSNSSQNSPNLLSIVQAIVNRMDWASGNSMAFVVSGGNATNYRIAESYNGNTANAPRLVISYSAPLTCQYTVNPNTQYEVRLPATNFNSGQPLNSLAPTTPTADASANGTSRDSNGIVLSGSQVVASLLTGDYGQNNHTYDFGFKTSTTAFSIGNRLWFDTNDNGIIDGAEFGISGVSVSVFLDANSDGQPDAPASPLGTVTTDATGYYRFDGLSAGNYVVRINPSNFNSGGILQSYANTSGNNTANVDSSGAASNAENGINPAVRNSVQTNGILSNTVSLNASSPTAEPDVPLSGSFAGQGSLDNQADVTVDLGFYSLCLSGTVWSDTSAAGNNDGILNNGEAGIPNAVVILYNSSNVEIPVGFDGILGTADDGAGGMPTDSSGNYNFCGLAPGTYRVVVNTSGGGTSSTPTQINPDNNVDHDDNGFPDNTGNFPNRVISGLIVLSAGGEPIVNNATGTTSNPTVDFGFVLAPLLVRLDSFDVYSESDGTAVTVKWSTASEDSNLGFNVYREANGKRELLNTSPIAGTALRSLANLEARSAGYSWKDDAPVSGALYYLEDIDMKGIRTLHGPIAPKIQFSSFDQKSNSRLFSDLAKLSEKSRQVDSIIKSETSANAPKNKARQLEIAAEKGVKIAVKRDGWYRVSLSELAVAGFDLNSNPNNWQLFMNGEEISFRFGADNAIEFYGRGQDTPETDKRIYYLTVGDLAGRRLPELDVKTVEKRNDAVSFRNTAAIKDRTMYLASVFNGDEENWFGAVIYQGAVNTYNLTAYNPAAEGQAHLKIKLQGVSDFGHSVSLKFNDLELGVLKFEDFNNETFDFDLPMSAVLAGNNQITFSGIGGEDDFTSVDEINLSYERQFIAQNNKLNFTVSAGQTVQIDGFGERKINVFEISRGQAVRRLEVQTEQTENGFGFGLNAANYDREFIAFADSQVEAPVSIVRNSPSTWNSAENKADFVIIAPERFRSSAENLARERQSEGLKTSVVPVEDIYDEFDFGAPTANAIKEFLRTATSAWSVKPKFVLLLGDSSYDMRNYLGQTERNLVPTKLVDTQFFETSSDAWFADFDDDGIEDISIGRLPAGNETQAARMIEKITRRATTENIREQRSNLLVADSGFDVNADALREMLPQNVRSNILRRSELSNPQMREEIRQQTNDGQTVITYIGHGSPIAWSNGNFFNANDASVLNNKKLSLYLIMTCLNGYTIDIYGDSLAESLIKSEGGAYAVWVSSGATHIGGQAEISRAATNLIFNSDNKPLRIGEIVRAAKQTTADADIRKTWQLIGDPTMFVR